MKQQSLKRKLQLEIEKALDKHFIEDANGYYHQRITNYIKVLNQNIDDNKLKIKSVVFKDFESKLKLEHETLTLTHIKTELNNMLNGNY
jgi:hypothetical protein